MGGAKSASPPSCHLDMLLRAIANRVKMRIWEHRSYKHLQRVIREPWASVGSIQCSLGAPTPFWRPKYSRHMKYYLRFPYVDTFIVLI